MDSKKTIAVLFHEEDRHYTLSRYVVHQLADYWRADGHQVVYLFGVQRFVPADIIFVHVNLSVVPEKYLKFASRYPIVLNGLIQDIRKTTISTNLVGRRDLWDGPVIVKSNLNCAGGPELLLRQSWLERHSWQVRRLRRALDRLGGDPYSFVENGEYRVFEHRSSVPGRLFSNRHIVVEKFRPEIEDGLYCTRVYQFLGDRWSCQRSFSSDPIVKAGTSARTEDIDPHTEIIAWRKKFDLDYGKLDYVINNGEVVLLDVNKTTGASLNAADEHVAASRQYQAEGLYSFFR